MWKTFKIKNKDCYETTVPTQENADKEHSNESHDFIVDRLNVVQIDTSKHSCAEVVKNRKRVIKMDTKKRKKK